jgi:hypothetical protein
VPEARRALEVRKADREMADFSSPFLVHVYIHVMHILIELVLHVLLELRLNFSQT